MENLFFAFFQEETLPVTEFTMLRDYPASKHRHNLFEILIPIAGHAENIYKGKSQTLSPGDIFILRPEDEHEIRFSPNDAHIHRDVYITPDQMKKICSLLSPLIYDKISSASEPIHFNIDIEKLNLIKKQLDLFDQNKSNIIDYESFHTCIVYEIFAFYIESQLNRYTVLPKWLQDLLTLLNNPDIMALTITEIVAFTNYSRGYVCDEFKKYTEKSLGTYITENRMNYSTTLLANTDIPISQITTRLGYDSQNSFIRNFQKQFGVTPAVWRKRNLPKPSDDKNLFS